jgi:hypothetical protein
MRIIGCDLHTRRQTIAMLDRETGEIVERTLKHDGQTARELLCSGYRKTPDGSHLVRAQKRARRVHAGSSNSG